VPAVETLEIFTTLLGHAQRPGVTHVVVEVADGPLQRESANLLDSSVFRGVVDGTLFCAGDALGAAAGVEWLEQRAIPVIGLSGVLSSSPLATAEARRATQLPVYPREALADAEVAARLVKPY